MKTYSYEAKPANGIPNLTESEIQEILSQNPIRVMTNRKPIEKDILIGALETLKVIYATHTGRDKTPKTVETSDHQPCNQCGSTDFVRTGTCFCCEVCGSSAGCS